MGTAELKIEVQKILEQNILPFWLDNMVDYENGGFYGRITGEGILEPWANKGGILNGRILWTFSAAFRVLHNPDYLEAAKRAKDYILHNFYDVEYGGTYWEVDYKGNPTDTKKQFYELGFMLYGLSEFYRATGDEEALEYSIRLFDTIERYAFDSVHNGYIEACTRDWNPIDDMRLSDKDQNFPKSHIFINKILNPKTHHLDLFFDKDWTRGGGTLESYGHDIECSWLLHEAALVLGDKEVLAKVEPVVKMVAKASEKGIQPDHSMVHEANLDTGDVDSDRHWWVQAEAVVGFLNIFQYFCDERSLQIALGVWAYIKDHLIDYEKGEWFWSCDANGVVNRVEDKAGFWKCPYHNSRMCLEIMERF